MGQNFSSLEYDNCQDLSHAPMLMQCFIHVTVNFKKKNPILPFEKFPILGLARNTIILTHLIAHSSLHYLPNGRLREVKNKAKFQTFSYKSGRRRLPEVSLATGSTYSDLTSKRLVFWKTGR